MEPSKTDCTRTRADDLNQRRSQLGLCMVSLRLINVLHLFSDTLTWKNSLMPPCRSRCCFACIVFLSLSAGWCRLAAEFGSVPRRRVGCCRAQIRIVEPGNNSPRSLRGLASTHLWPQLSQRFMFPTKEGEWTCHFLIHLWRHVCHLLDTNEFSYLQVKGVSRLT